VVDLATARENRRAARLGLVLVIAALFFAVLLMRGPSSS
jgi:hypothetical protein